MQIEASSFDAAKVPSGTQSLAIHTIRKADLSRLQGLDRLAIDDLHLRWLSAPDLTFVPLPPGLRGLTIMHSSRCKSLAGITQAPGLRRLAWLDTGALSDFAPLHDLPELEELAIEGGMSSKQKVPALGQLAGLNLRRLTLRGVTGPDLALDAVADMGGLQDIDLHAIDFEPEDLAKVAAARPDYYTQLKDLKDYPAGLGMKCKKCGGPRKELFLKGLKWLWCPVCEAAGIEKALARFDALVAAELDKRGDAA
ncbi:MAG: hypothetical protein AAF914_00485 [Pseudomonadota bacterium]